MARQKKTAAKTKAQTAQSEPAPQKGRTVDPGKRYAKKIYKITELPIPKRKSLRSFVANLETRAEQLDQELLRPGQKLAIRIERSTPKGRKYNSSRRIFDSFKQLGQYLLQSNSLDRNADLLKHIQVIEFENQFNADVWQAQEDILKARRTIRNAEKRTAKAQREKMTRRQLRQALTELRSATSEVKRLKKVVKETESVQRSKKATTGKSQRKRASKR